MNTAQIESAVKESLHRLAPEADVEALRADADIRETLDIDSFDFLNLLVALQQRLGVDVPETEYARVRTFGGLTAYLEGRLSAGAGA